MQLVNSVLLVDDCERTVLAWSNELQTSQRTISVARTRSAALELCRSKDHDLAIVDIFLGRDDGLTLIADLRRLSPRMFIAAVSGCSSVAHTVAAIRAGANDVLAKPARCSEVLERVHIHTSYIDAPRRQIPSCERVKSFTLDEVTWEYVTRVLVQCGGNRTRAAQRLGIARQSLQRKLRKRLG